MGWKNARKLIIVVWGINVVGVFFNEAF